MNPFARFFLQLERRLHPKIKEGIAKSLVYYFTLKEITEYQKPKYAGHLHLLDQFNRLIRIAHRGFSGEYPENTLLAFGKALEQEADILELDVQLSLDGEIVVCHDPQLQRLTGKAEFIRDLPYHSLRQLDVGSWKSPAYAGLKLPSLAEVFETLPAETLLNIEIKHEATSFFNWETEKAILRQIKAYGREQQVILSAFNPMVVNRIRKLDPRISTAYLITQTFTPLLVFLLRRIACRYLYVDLRYLRPKLVRKFQQKGIRILGYTLNTAAEYQLACELGLDGIISDYPNRLRNFLEARKETPNKDVFDECQ